MKKVGLLTLCLATVGAINLSGGAAEPKPLNYINLTALTEKYELKHERDPITGRETFSGNGTKLILCSGMITMMINDQLTILKDQAKTINGEIAIPMEDIQKIETKIKENKAEHVKKEYGLKKIVIDAGHGGPFTGAEGANGVLEKKITLSVTLKLKKILEAKGIKVVLTRERDTSLSPILNDDLDRRVEVANREQPDLFISIHCNWTPKSSVQGFEIYYSPNKPLPSPKLDTGNSTPSKASELDAATRKILSYALHEEYQQETQDLSQEIQKAFNKLPTEDRGVREADFRVIKKTECPAILVEMDYISNRKMCKELCDDEYQNRVTQQLSEGILKFQETMEGAAK